MKGGDIKTVDTHAIREINYVSTIGLPLFHNLNSINQGTSFYERVGTRISMEWIDLKYRIYPTRTNLAAVDDPLMGRVMLVYDLQTNAAFPAQNDLLQNYDEIGLGALFSWGERNPNNKARFEVLWDSHFVLPPIGINGASPASNVLTFESSNQYGLQGSPNGGLWYDTGIDLRGLDTQYFRSIVGQNVRNITTGSLFLYWMVDQDTHAWQIEFFSRLKFKG